MQSIGIMVFLAQHIQRGNEMTLTKQWVESQIKEYTALTGTLFIDPSMKECDEKLAPIWEAMLNTLKTTLKVINLEMGI